MGTYVDGDGFAGSGAAVTPRGFAGGQPAGDDPVREARPASALEPAERSAHEAA